MCVAVSYTHLRDLSCIKILHNQECRLFPNNQTVESPFLNKSKPRSRQKSHRFLPSNYYYYTPVSYTHLMQNCFKMEYAFYSPLFRGTYDFLIKQIQNESKNVMQIDFTRGDEPYKYKLGGVEMQDVYKRQLLHSTLQIQSSIFLYCQLLFHGIRSLFFHGNQPKA